MTKTIEEMTETELMEVAHVAVSNYLSAKSVCKFYQDESERLVNNINPNEELSNVLKELTKNCWETVASEHLKNFVVVANEMAKRKKGENK